MGKMIMKHIRGMGPRAKASLVFAFALLASFISVLPAVAANPLLHNSDNLGTKYGTWGVAGGKYGAFDCTTCHSQTTTNIKRIKTPIVAPLGLWSSSKTSSVAVVFGSMTSFGKDTNHATSSNICEVCHSKTLHHRYNNAGAPNHNGAVDCTGCHKHNQAFKGAGDCNTCHDYDTRGATYSAGVWSGGSWGILPYRDVPPLTVGEGWGAHAKHINYIKTRLGIGAAGLTPAGQAFGVGEPANVCGTCHTNLSANHTTSGSTVRTISFGDGLFKMGGATGTSLLFGTTFPAQNPLYNGTSGVSSATTAKTCANLSCHYSLTPVWSAY